MADEEKSRVLQWNEMDLDDRILLAISKLGWAEPTMIQEKAIPLALQGKDILSRARTGSGKTAAYAIPVIQKILNSKQLATEQTVKAFVLTPTKELSHQAYKNILDLTANCSKEVKCIDISGQIELDAQRPMLMEQPDVVVGPPSRIFAHLKAGNLKVKESLELLVIDEADLVFSFGYENDVKQILKYLPKIFQSFLMSATLSEDVKSLKKLVLHNPVILKLEEARLPETSQLTQYHIKCEQEDKFVLIYALFKLRLILGKSLIFVNSVDRCYKLKLFLRQFGIGTCVLNSELPGNSRCHIVNQFNDGLYDVLISSDERADQIQQKGSQKNRKKRKKDLESGVSRGIDFQKVSNVINFDFPMDVDSYIHRVGRTARGDCKGTALSFVSLDEMPRLEEIENTLSDSTRTSLFKPYNFKMDELEGFRYRAKDAMRMVTTIAIKQARVKEIKAELLTSEKLKSYFEDNPRDLQVLRHDTNCNPIRTQSHMKNVPDYIIPPTLQKLKRPISSTKTGVWKKKSKEQERRPTRGELKYQKRKADPLKSFEFRTEAKRKK
ncbi:putative ATP-dependent RNA helicase DDX56 isoform X2 [Tubulanus polymorphus]|uniref:putative ATP-dependent RNA helicase DDX56 isoform X2 n=1 Tax=Tubulanus polymorphus TaxID=672921 RepID=UPI003DA310F4